MKRLLQTLFRTGLFLSIMCASCWLVVSYLPRWIENGAHAQESPSDTPTAGEISRGGFIENTPRAIGPKDLEVPEDGVTSFEECVAKYKVVTRSYPPQCRTKDGRTFVKKMDSPIVIGNPAQGEKACKDLCGDGKCQEMVCQAVGCPCAESAANCPEDCKP